MALCINAKHTHNSHRISDHIGRNDVGGILENMRKPLFGTRIILPSKKMKPSEKNKKDRCPSGQIRKANGECVKLFWED